MDQNRKKQEKNNKKGGIAAAVLIAIGILSDIFESGEAATVIAILVVICAVVAIIAAVSKAAKKKTAASQPVHTHDRLSKTSPIQAENCTGGKAHWKKQLDSFLNAGIIDRAEYRVLWEKYKDFYDN